MMNLKKGMKLQSLENEEVIATVKVVTKNKSIALDVNGAEVITNMEDVDKKWQVLLDGSNPVDTKQEEQKPADEEKPADEQKPADQQPPASEQQNPEGGTGSNPEPQPDETYTALKSIYDALTGHCKGMQGVEHKVNTNGTTACKVTGKGNFAEIRLQKKRLVMRVLHEVAKETGLELKAIPDTYGWTYKTEIIIRTTDAIEKLIAELDASKAVKTK